MFRVSSLILPVSKVNLALNPWAGLFPELNNNTSLGPGVSTS